MTLSHPRFGNHAAADPGGTRVLKYEPFINAFPDVLSLARPLAGRHGQVGGTGYNRRALALKDIARRLVTEFQGRLPARLKPSAPFPASARPPRGPWPRLLSISRWCSSRPTFAGFFSTVSCRGKRGQRPEILPLVDQTLDRKQPRPWYYALMDYGPCSSAPPQSQPEERPLPAAGPLCRFRPPDPGPDPQGPPQIPGALRGGAG